jgi:hypothetical protein
MLTGLYRTLLASGGSGGRSLSEATVWKVHAVLQKAFNDAVLYEQLLPNNPADRAKRPRRDPRAALDVWTPGQLRAFLTAASSHRLYASIDSRPTPALVAVSCSTSAGRMSTGTHQRSGRPGANGQPRPWHRRRAARAPASVETPGQASATCAAARTCGMSTPRCC